MGVTGWSSYKNSPNNLPAVDATKSVNQFANALNNMNFSYSFDYAVGIMK